MAMNSEPNISQQPPISSVASTRPQHSSRTSPLPTATTTTTTTTDKSTMAAAPTFVPAAPAFRPSPSSKSSYQLNMNAAHFFEREPTKPVGTPFASTPPPIVRVLIRRLPINTTEESLRLMLVWSKEQAEIELLPLNTSEDEGFRSALLRFRTMAAALEAKSMLDGRSNISKDAEMVVEVLAGTPPTARKNANEQLVANAAVTSAPGPPSLPPARQPARYNGFQSFDSSVSPTSNGAFLAHDYIHADPNSHYQSIFSALPLGNHISERPRITGKSLISSDFGDDDETSDLLKDPVAYAESGATSQRRATAPQIPVTRMGNMSLSSNHPQGSASLPHYMNSLSPVNAPGQAAPGQGPGLGYATNGHNYSRLTFPPVNPADQNPPCNTLYVGNLPIDTSEEELKAMFSKQRGYKRLCFRTKQNGPMCFVEFEDITFATKALHDLYGHPLHNSVKGGIRLSFSKNPLGVRSGQAPGQGSNNAMGSMNNSMMVGAGNGFSTHGPPPGLAAPPGLGSGRGNYNLASSMNTGGNRLWNTNYTNGFAGGHGHPWNTPAHNNGVAAGSNSGLNNNTSFYPQHMMGK